MLLRAIVVTTALACIYALPTPGTIVPERESEMDGAVVPLAMSLLSTVQQNTGYTLEAIQADARTLKDVHRNVDSMSDAQRLQGVDALKNDKTLSAEQLDAVLAIQMMTEKWNNEVRPGYVPRDHPEVHTIREVLRDVDTTLNTAATQAETERNELAIKREQRTINTLREHLTRLQKVTEAPSPAPTPAPTTDSFKMVVVGQGCCRFPGWAAQAQGIQTEQECKLRCLEAPSCVAADTSHTGPNDTFECHTFSGDGSGLSARSLGCGGASSSDICYKKETASFKWMKVQLPPTCPQSDPFRRCGQGAYTIEKYFCQQSDGTEVDAAECSHLTKPRDFSQTCAGSNGCVGGYSEYSGYSCPNQANVTVMAFSSDPRLASVSDTDICKNACDDQQTCSSFKFDPIAGECFLHGATCTEGHIEPGCVGCEGASIYVKGNSAAPAEVDPARRQASADADVTETDERATLKQAQDDEAVAQSAKDTACTTEVVFSNSLDSLEGHRCIEDVVDVASTSSYITVKAGCDSAKVALAAAQVVVAAAELRVSRAAETAYVLWMKLNPRNLDKNFHESDHSTPIAAPVATTPVTVTCECNNPGSTQAGQNGYTCTDHDPAHTHCASNELCYATAPFTKGDWSSGCATVATTNAPTDAPTQTTAPTDAPTQFQAQDCSKHNGKCYSTPSSQIIAEIPYWRDRSEPLSTRMNSAMPGTVNGVACDYGSSPAESYCNCQYLCQQNSQCAAFEVYNENGGQAICKLLSRACSVRPSNNGDFYGACNANRN